MAQGPAVVGHLWYSSPRIVAVDRTCPGSAGAFEIILGSS